MIEVIQKYFPDLTDLQLEQYAALKNLYEEWNAKINVISRKDIDNLYVNHVLHSMTIGNLIKFIPGTKVIDVGTGGGFPGIPLAILFPDVKFHLVDSIGKKITVVTEIVKALQLANVTAAKTRAEDIANADKSFDFVVSRAVASVGEIYNWTRRLIKPHGQNDMPNGMFFFKGGDLDLELQEVAGQKMLFDIYSVFPEENFKDKKIVYIAVGEKRINGHKVFIHK